MQKKIPKSFRLSPECMRRLKRWSKIMNKPMVEYLEESAIIAGNSVKINTELSIDYKEGEEVNGK